MPSPKLRLSPAEQRVYAALQQEATQTPAGWVNTRQLVDAAWPPGSPRPCGRLGGLIPHLISAIGAQEGVLITRRQNRGYQLAATRRKPKHRRRLPSHPAAA